MTTPSERRAGTSVEQFRAALTNPLARRALHLDMTDGMAAWIATDPAPAAALYERWVATGGVNAPPPPPPPPVASAGPPPAPPVPAPTTWAATPYPPPPPPAPSPFPFRRPLARDWVFWWAVLIEVLTVIAMIVNSGGTLGAFLINSLLAVPLNFVVFVLPVALIRSVLARTQRRPPAPWITGT